MDSIQFIVGFILIQRWTQSKDGIKPNIDSIQRWTQSKYGFNPIQCWTQFNPKKDSIQRRTQNKDGFNPYLDSIQIIKQSNQTLDLI